MNDLSMREGIEWNDPVGLALARRVDPDVTYLGPGYERALFTYYRQLWQREPRAMARVYWEKLWSASASTFEFLISREPSIFWDRKDGWWLTIAASCTKPG